MTLAPDRLIERLRHDVGAALGADLLGLYVHGSWVLGDFEPRRSDLDLLAVLAADPDERTEAALRALHDRIAADHPEWTDRVEVDYVSVDGLRDFRTEPRPMVRISPGEPLHRVPATGHYLLNWYAAREQGVALLGSRDLIPPISVTEWKAAVREHLRQWPQWVTEMATPDAQAYAVLTVCRGLHALEVGHQVSKRAAGSWAAHRFPADAGLIGWAIERWYGADRSADVIRFVAERVGPLPGGQQVP